jgi:DNA-binding GntR family transcriptional regulator
MQSNSKSYSRKTQAFEFIRNAILTGKYPPGQTLTEGDLAREIGVSRTPVREALNILSREGLVETIPNRGAIVRSLSAQDLLDIFDIKIRLEGLCAARAAEQSGSPTADRLYQALEMMSVASKSHDRVAYLNADESFHAAIYKGAHNEHAHKIVVDLNNLWHRVHAGMLVIESRMETAVEEHKAIANAIAARDPEGAESAMRVHLERLRDEIKIVLESFGAPLGNT